MTDERLGKVLKQAMPQIMPDAEMNRQLLAEMDGKKRGRFRGKRVVAMAVVCMLMLSSITVAATAIYYYSVARTNDFHTKDYRKIDYVEEVLGCDIKFIRNMASGFTFEQMDIFNDTLYAVEKDGDVAFSEESESVVIWYEGDRGRIMLVCTKDDSESVENDANNARDVAGVRVRYEEKIVSKEEISVYISSVDGIKGVEYPVTEELMYNSVQWIQDGVHYFLGAMPDVVIEEELLSIAEELILCK